MSSTYIRYKDWGKKGWGETWRADATQWAGSQSVGSIEKIKETRKIPKKAKAARRNIGKESAVIKKTMKIRDKDRYEGIRQTNHKRDEMEQWQEGV